MGKFSFKGQLKYPGSSVDVVGLSLISFKEDDVTIIYCPSLDLSGYGDSEDEAKHSFEIVLEEFFRYTINKGTYISELEKFGWQMSGSKKQKRFKPPYLDHLLRDKTYLSEIIREKEFHRFNYDVPFPVPA